LTRLFVAPEPEKEHLVGNLTLEVLDDRSADLESLEGTNPTGRGHGLGHGLDPTPVHVKL